ncbi:MAG: YifB family Mg chelatase-like AAA ATPase [Puniceicoccaceae bacterium]
MFSVAQAAALQGIDAKSVQVEVNFGEEGRPDLVLVGLPDAAVKESRDRVCSALENSGYRRPDRHTTINLAPGDIRKEGPCFDLPIALSLLSAAGKANLPRLEHFLIVGELGLSGKTRPIKGALAMTLLARELGMQGILLPSDNVDEASLVADFPVFGVPSLAEAVTFLSGSDNLQPASPSISAFRQSDQHAYQVDFSEIKGQQSVRRAVEVAVAGGHNLLIIGPPGSGKSMIAKRIPTIMPEPDPDEFLEILRIQSAAGATLDPSSHAYRRPFRAPHHTISDVGLLGGGSIPGPGEISLAHHGVLFLDELPEFRRSTLEVLRQPLEDGKVTISRSAGKITLPCSFMLVAAMNPTPDGHDGSDGQVSRSTPAQIQRYRSRISGPLLDRIDLHVEAPALSVSELQSAAPGESSHSIRERIKQCRSRQSERFASSSTTCNARMNHRELSQHVGLNDQLAELLRHAMTELNLSARAYDRILKVSRTIADLAQSEAVESNHLLEAIHYRNLDRTVFL